MPKSADVSGDEMTGVGIEGDPTQAGVWSSLEMLLTRGWRHESGQRLLIVCTLIDSGYIPSAVYAFVKPRQKRSVFASKGVGGAGVPLVTKRVRKADGISLVRIGTDNAKDVLSQRLAVTDPGPGYVHFPTPTLTGLDDSFFEQFLAERRRTRVVGGKRVGFWEQIKDRNEAIDLFVGNIAALHLLGAAATDHLHRWVAIANGEESTPSDVAGGGLSTPGTGQARCPNKNHFLNTGFLRSRLGRHTACDPQECVHSATGCPSNT